jgi:hypothetical protein
VRYTYLLVDVYFLARLHSDNSRSRSSSRRFRALLKILALDNCSLLSDKIVHWCTGADCCRLGKPGALQKLVNAYLQLLAPGFPPPLLYRWKHASTAQNYVQDGMCLHQILLRVLNHMAGKMSAEKEQVVNDLLAAAAAAGNDGDADFQALEQARDVNT